MSKAPPKFLLRFFKWFCDPDLHKYLEGDLIELFEKNTQEKGYTKAKRLFALDILRLFRPSIIKPASGGQKLNYYGMFKHNFKTGLRSILKHKPFSFINIVGLSTGVAVCMVALIFYRYETSFDHYHEKADQTFRVVQHTQRPEAELYWNTTAYPLAAALRTDFPDFAEVTQTAGPMKRMFQLEKENGPVVRFEEEHVLFVDQDYPKVFDLGWVAGNKETALANPDGVVISERIARKCFGDNYNPSTALGQTLLLNNNDPLIITGIIQAPPPNTNLRANMLVSYQFFKRHNPFPSRNWSGNYRGTTFLVLEENSNPLAITEKINEWKKNYLNESDDQIISYHLQPLKEIHNETKYGSAPGSYQISSAILNTSLVVAAFILLIAMVNFVNLVTARASTRAKEVGIRKTIGGTKGALLGQFIIENGMLVFFSMILSLLMASLLLDEVNRLLSGIGMELYFNMTDLFIGLGICFSVIILSIIYPSAVLSSFKTTSISSGSFQGKVKGLGIRKGFTFVQFTLIQLFIIAAIIVGAQLQYFQSQSLGFQSDQVVMVPIPSGDKVDLFSTLMNEKREIAGVSIGSGPPMAVDNFALGTTYRLPHQSENEGMSAEMKITDSTYLDLYDIALIAGRNFRENKNQFDEFIINKTMALSLGWQPNEALGKKLRINEGEATVVGVIEDFHNHSLHNEITPVVLLNWQGWRWQASLKIADYKSLIVIEEVWKELFPDQIFSYRFVDDSIAKEYVIEGLIFKGFRFFSFLVILIGCLGLFGLVSFMALQKKKEIGIRKVLGASVNQILTMFTKNYAVLIVAGFFVATPVVYYFIQQWLDSFVYHIPLSVWMFLAGGAITLLLAAIVSIVKSVSAAKANPVDALRSE